MEKQRELKPGDLVWADRSAKGLPYSHCGIYVGGGYVIHFAAPEGSEVDAKNAEVHRVPFEHFKDGCPVRIIDIESSFSVDETLRRANNCIGRMRGQYNLATFNCEHFATWCKTGEHRSLQVDEAKVLLKEIGGSPIVDAACEIHDIAEMVKASRLSAVYPEQENEILDTLETNAYLGETIPPISDDEEHIADYEIIEEAPEETDDEDDSGGHPSPQKAWYEKTAGVLKLLTYPIAGALEILKRTKLPILRKIPFLVIGAKVRNIIDNIVTTIKVFTGRMTKEEANTERMNNETALAGHIVGEKQSNIVETLKQVFGKVGSGIKHFVQTAVGAVVPKGVRNMIKGGAKKIGMGIVSAVKSFAHKAKEKATAFFGRIKQKLFG